jgi:hypothetical protein
MADLLINPTTGDLVFINGQCPMTYEMGVTVAQRLRIKILTFQGEWFLNTEYGVPYFQTIFVQGTSKSTIDATYQELILSDPDVLEIVEFNSIVDVEARTYQLSFRVRITPNVVTDYVDILLGI